MIYLLNVLRPGDLTSTRWYFDDLAQMERAERLAREAGAATGRAGEDFISDADELRAWLHGEGA